MAVRDPLRPPSGGHCPSGMQHDVGAHGDGGSSEFSSVGAAGEGLQCLSLFAGFRLRSSVPQWTHLKCVERLMALVRDSAQHLSHSAF